MQFVETFGVTNCNAFLGLHPNEKSVLLSDFSDHVFMREQNVKMRTISTKRVNSKYKMLYFAKWIHEKARDTNNMLVTK